MQTPQEFCKLHIWIKAREQSPAPWHVTSLLDYDIASATGHTHTDTLTHCYLLPGNSIKFETIYRLFHFHSLRTSPADAGRDVQECKKSVHKWKAEDGSSVTTFRIRGNGCSLYIYLKLYLEYCMGITLKKVIVLLGTSRRDKIISSHNI